MFSIIVLKNQQKGLKGFVERSSSLLNRQQNFSTTKKNSISKLFDDCAWQSIQLKELEETHKNVLAELNQIEDTRKRIESLGKINKNLSTKMERLNYMVKHIESTYADHFINDKSMTFKTHQSSESQKLSDVVDRILLFYSLFVGNINTTYKVLHELQNEKERKKNLFIELLSHLTVGKSLNCLDDNNRPEGMQIEHIQQFSKFLGNCEFLVQAKNSIFFYGIRLHKMIDAVNRKCRLLDFDYHLAILCPFNNDSYVLKPISNNEIHSSVLSDDDETRQREVTCIPYEKNEGCILDSSYTLAPWVHSYFPCFGQYDPSTTFSNHFLRFYESVLRQFYLLKEYLNKFNSERKECTIGVTITLPKLSRIKEKKVGIQESSNNKKNSEKKSIILRNAKNNLMPRQSISKISSFLFKKPVKEKQHAENLP